MFRNPIPAFPSLALAAHSASRRAGWYDPPADVRNLGEMLALVHSEITEAYDALVSGRPSEKIEGLDEFAEELADTYIRLGDFCAYQSIYSPVGFAAARLWTDVHRAKDGEALLAAGGVAFLAGSFAEPSVACAKAHTAVTGLLEALRKRGPEDETDQSAPFSVWVWAAAAALVAVVLWAEVNDVDLLDAIEKKMSHNRTRGHKHGGKKF